MYVVFGQIINTLLMTEQFKLELVWIKHAQKETYADTNTQTGIFYLKQMLVFALPTWVRLNR